MQDATAIHFISRQKQGVGTRFVCDTKVWKFRLKDKMTVTYWEDDYYMGVSHEGLISGSGTFVLEPDGEDGTDFIWEENLIFPWFLGGRVGAFAARPILKKVWGGNVLSLKQLVEFTSR